MTITNEIGSNNTLLREITKTNKSKDRINKLVFFIILNRQNIIIIITKSLWLSIIYTLLDCNELFVDDEFDD